MKWKKWIDEDKVNIDKIKLFGEGLVVIGIVMLIPSWLTWKVTSFIGYGSVSFTIGMWFFGTLFLSLMYGAIKHTMVRNKIFD
jgi:hypothetical protein